MVALNKPQSTIKRSLRDTSFVRVAFRSLEWVIDSSTDWISCRAAIVRHEPFTDLNLINFRSTVRRVRRVPTWVSLKIMGLWVCLQRLGSPMITSRMFFRSPCWNYPGGLEVDQGGPDLFTKLVGHDVWTSGGLVRMKYSTMSDRSPSDTLLRNFTEISCQIEWSSRSKSQQKGNFPQSYWQFGID
jgi:hypothetical protein